MSAQGAQFCMTRQLGRRVTVALIFLLGSLVGGQDDHAKEKAVSQMRQIAKAIKQCPEEIEHRGECDTFYHGPPTNVEWDVLPSKTVRSPFQGVIEFTLPHRRQGVDPATQSKQVHRMCMALEADAARNRPKVQRGHYRYEFDLGSDTPELVKMLWVVDETKEVVAASTSGNQCWVKVARSFDPASIGNTSSSSPKPQ